MRKVLRSILTKRKLLYLALLLVLIALAVWFSAFNKAPENKSETQTTNYNTISDSSTGLSFNMSKKFETIPREELAAMNPGFTYGFRPNDDPNAQCIVSQTKLAGRGSATGEELRNGIMDEVRKVHPDAVVANESTALNPVKFGEAQGILLEILYTEGGSKIKRVEIIALGNVNQVIAYCQSLASDNQRYYDDFTIFFSSLKLSE